MKLLIGLAVGALAMIGVAVAVELSHDAAAMLRAARE